MASPNQPPPFDMHSFFNPPNPNLNPNPNPNPNNISSQFPPSAPSPPPPSSSSSYPPPTGPFTPTPFPHHNNNNNYPFDHHHFPIQHRSLSFPTPPLQPQPIPPPSNPNAGARLMALLSNPPPNPNQNPTHHHHQQQLQQQQQPSVPFSSDYGVVNSVNSPLVAPSAAAITAANAAAAALIRLPSSKVPKGRHLVGDHVMYDVDARLPGEMQPQLEVAPITKYGSDPNPVLGRQIAVNKSYICYGLKQGNIRVLNIHTAVRSLLRGHTQV